MKEHPRTQRRGAPARRVAVEVVAALAIGVSGALLVGGWGTATGAVGAAGTAGTTASGTVPASSHDGGALHWPAGPWANAVLALVVFGAMLGLAQLRRRQGARSQAGERETAGRR